MDVYLRLLAFLRPHRARIVAGVVATLFLAGATSLYAFLIGPLLKTLLAGGTATVALPLVPPLPRERLLVWLPLALVLVAGFRAGAQALQSFLMASAGQRVVADLRRALYARFLGLPQAYLTSSRSGDLLARFGADVQSVEFALTFAFSSYVRDGAQVVALLGVCAFLDWRLLLAALCSVPLAAFPVARFGSALKKVTIQGQRSLGDLASQVGEGIANVRVVQAFGREDAELARLDSTQARYLGLMRRSFLLRAAFTPVLEMLGVLGLATALYLAGSAIAGGTLSGETLMSFLASLMLMYQPVKALSTTGQHVLQGMASGKRIFEVLDGAAGLAEPATAGPARFERTVAFRDITFAYGEEPVLREVSLQVAKGRTLALVGESGSGKSTLASLLLRFYDPQQGAVEIDGVDLRRLRLSQLRGLIAFVPQEPVLFAGTVRDNVACGREGASELDVIRALEAAHAWDFVREMPGGLDAPIGERGAGLSGGQRQRLALARAFVADAPIIVLDEATSALDSASEALVQRGLERLLAGRTALVIAHRLSTIQGADEIAVLAGGRVIETGTHAALLAKGGRYAALWGAQGGESPAQAPARASGEA